MKKILLTTNHPAPYINKQIEILRKEFEVDIIYHWRKDNYKTWKDFVGIEGRYFDELSIFGFFKEYKKHDIAILGGWANKYCLLTILLNFLFRTKCGVFSDHPIPDFKKNNQYYFKRFVIFKCLDYIFCATESTRNFYHNHYGIPYSKLLFYPYPYDDKFTEDNKKINSQRIELLKTSKEKINIFIANNFIDRKGYNAIVSAFVKLHKQGLLSQYCIKIAGNGVLFDSVKSKLDALYEDIEFFRWIESDQYVDLMNHCDIYIHASRFEPFGIPPLDALCREKLLIASQGVESVNAMIEDGVDGFLFEVDNDNELVRILANLDKNNIYTMGKKGRNKVLKTYNDSVYLTSMYTIK